MYVPVILRVHSELTAQTESTLDLDLAKYNTTRLDFGPHNAADASTAADEFWKSITDGTTDFLDLLSLSVQY